MLLENLQGKLKLKRVLIYSSIFLSWFASAIKAEERDPFFAVLKTF